MPFRLGAASDRGRIREGNEDSFVASGSLAAVADGDMVKLANSTLQFRRER